MPAMQATRPTWLPTQALLGRPAGGAECLGIRSVTRYSSYAVKVVNPVSLCGEGGKGARCTKYDSGRDGTGALSAVHVLLPAFTSWRSAWCATEAGTRYIS